MDDFLYIGRVAKPHGVRGEMKVFPTTDDVKRFDLLDEVFIETDKSDEKYAVLGVKYVGKFVVLKLEGFDTPEQIMPLRNAIVKIEKSKGIALEEDEYYFSDLLGMKVVTADGVLGRVKDIIRTGANDVYEVEMPDGKTVLIPAIKDCIKKIDLEANAMTVELMEGLL